MKIAIRLRNFCKVHMIEIKDLSNADGCLYLALRQTFIREAIDSHEGDYALVAELLGLHVKVVRSEYHAPSRLLGTKYRLKIIKHKAEKCKSNYQKAINRLKSLKRKKNGQQEDLKEFESLSREMNHWSNRVLELQTIRRNILNGDPEHGKVIESIPAVKLPNNLKIRP